MGEGQQPGWVGGRKIGPQPQWGTRAVRCSQRDIDPDQAASKDTAQAERQQAVAPLPRSVSAPPVLLARHRPVCARCRARSTCWAAVKCGQSLSRQEVDGTSCAAALCHALRRLEHLLCGAPVGGPHLVVAALPRRVSWLGVSLREPWCVICALQAINLQGC